MHCIVIHLELLFLQATATKSSKMTQRAAAIFDNEMKHNIASGELMPP